LLFMPDLLVVTHNKLLITEENICAFKN
jgi:hypothetical protein